MNQETIENSELVDDTETVSNETSKEADENENVHDIMEEMPSSGIFSYPKLDEFLEGNTLKKAILKTVEFGSGKYGESVALYLDGIWYRSSSETVKDEARFLLEKNLFPCKVFVAEKKSENGRTYYTLRGGEDE